MIKGIIMKVKDVLKFFDEDTVVFIQDKKGYILYGAKKIHCIKEDYAHSYILQYLLDKETIVSEIDNHTGFLTITIKNPKIDELKRKGLNAWIDEGDKYKCSSCGFKLYDTAYWYCPHCGEKMEGIIR